MGRDVFGIVGTTQAGNLRVEKVVAEGGFGVVYRAEHGGFRAPVALKCLKIPGTMTVAEREAFLEKFREEGELLFRLSASIPEVVRPLHVDALTLPDGRFVPFIALEWLEGEALDQILERRRAEGKAPMTLPKLMKLMRPIAHALSRAHRFPGRGGVTSIVHRDLKPDNIFVAELNGIEMVKILDFGIAKAKSAASQRAGRLTAEDGLQAFTPAYGAPEQWVPKRFGQTGPWTDVWGLALTMVEALAGKPPIDGDVTGMMGTAIDEKRRPTPRAEGVTIAAEVEAVFLRALAVDPRERTPDVETFWSELEIAMGLPPSLISPDSRREEGGDVQDRLVSIAPVSRGLVERSSAATVPALDVPSPSAGAIGARPKAVDASPLSLEFPLPVAPASRSEATNDFIPTPAPISRPHGSAAFALAPTPSPVRSRPRVPRTESRADSMDLRDLGARVRRPLQLMGIAIAITVLDVLVTRFTGESLMIGPLRPAWIAGPFALAGLGLALWRIFGDRGDG